MKKVTQIESSQRPALVRLVRSLRFRLTALVVLIIVAISAVGLLLDYRREYRTHVDEQLATLTEQARALRQARGYINDPRQFARYVDAFCAQMNENISPGHHILILAPDGRVAVRARHHSGEAVEKALLDADPADALIELDGRHLAQVRLQDADGTTVIVGQFLDNVQRVLRNQMISRAVATAATGLAIVLLIYLAMERWVLGPIARLKAAARRWALREFEARAPTGGPPDLSSLAARFNAMAEELERHELGRAAALRRARSIQENLLPDSLPDVPGLSLAAGYEPAEGVAGDLYDVFGLGENRTAIVMLDVAGHGIAAALLTGVVKMSLHRRLAECDGPADAMQRVNNDLLACASEGQFVTAFVAVWDSSSATLTYSSAGHPPAIMVGDSEFARLDSTGPLLGIFAEDQWDERSIAIPAGGRLFIYTDGIPDAGIGFEPLGEAGLRALLEETADLPLADQVEAVMNETRRRNTPDAADDATLLALESTAKQTA